nr:DNA polymerase III subunit beta [Actinomycetota bacterium]
MKFRCERDVLVEALTSASRATSGRERLPVLAGARLEVSGDELRITATDLDLTIEVVATVAGVADGVAVIPAKLAADIVRALEPGAVTIEAD